jgi:hypothetical protein
MLPCLALVLGVALGQTASAPDTSTAPASSSAPATATAPAPVRAPATATAPAETATTISGEPIFGKLLRIDQGQAEFAPGWPTRKVPITDLWRVRLRDHEDLMSRRGQKVLLLRDGGELACDEVSLQAGEMTLKGRQFAQAVVNISAAAVVYLTAGEQTPAGVQRRHREMNLPAANTDFLVAENARGEWVPAPGVLKSIADGKVTFEWDKQDRTLDVGTVRVIQLAPVPGKVAAPRGRLTGADGSVVPFGSIAFDGKSFTLQGAGLSLTLPEEAVAEIRLQSDRLTYLSDLQPAKVVQKGQFDMAVPYRADRSSTGGPLRLGGMTHAKGLGLHSRCELSYNLEGKFAVFAATAGIDEAAGAHGDASLTVRGDGKDLLGPVDLKAGQAPVPVRCRLAGVRQLVILVDFGEDSLDVGDHVDLVDARLIVP